MEPDSCVQRTENFFTRHGIRALILAKFIPALSTLAPALAGLFGITLKRFLLYNGLGAVLWTLAFVLPGYVFSTASWTLWLLRRPAWDRSCWWRSA